MAGWAGSLAGNGATRPGSPRDHHRPCIVVCSRAAGRGKSKGPASPLVDRGKPAHAADRPGTYRYQPSCVLLGDCSCTRYLRPWELVFLPPKTHALPFNVLALPYPLPHCNLSSSDLPSDLSDLQCILSFNEPESVRSSSSRAFLDSRSSFHSLPTRLQRFSLSGDDTTTSRTPRTATVYHRTVPNTFSRRKLLRSFAVAAASKTVDCDETDWFPAQQKPPGILGFFFVKTTGGIFFIHHLPSFSTSPYNYKVQAT